MNQPNNSFRLTKRLDDIIEKEMGHDPMAQALFSSLLARTNYQREFCLELLDTAQGSRSLSWKLRRLAILMLEHQMLKLSPDDVSEFDFLFGKLGIKSANGYVSDAMLKEGYSTTRLADFVREFRLRLSRLNRVHLGLRGNRTSKKALGDFIHISRIDCKLSLARYAFTPAEVVDRITGELIQSTGVRDLAAFDHPQVGREIDHGFERLPRYESEIVRLLCEGSKIYWVSDTTSSEINSLVEYPLNTVVLVIKPPGSDVEFEIKRAGLRGSRPLDAVYERDGYEVPSTHRLYAGSMAYYLRWEAGAAANFSKLYRLIHRTEAPLSRTLSLSTIYTVPVNGAEQHIVRYFSDFSGTSHPDAMRRAMRQAIAAFVNENGSGASTPWLPGDLGLATQFLGHVVPSQSLLMGTSSFRLDRLASYLSPQGADIYFAKGLNVSFTRDQARRFADELLEEVLGIYTPPSGSYRNHDQYIKSALSENRAKADSNYLSLMREIGKVWGTLLGTNGRTHGESFVGRNVGLKSVFENGEWKVKIVFLDHDAMYLTDPTTDRFRPSSFLAGMATDERYIMGGPNVRGETELLEAIYRVDKTVAAEGHSALNDGLREAYRKTHSDICSDPRLQGRFSRGFAEGIRVWDQIVVCYLSVRDDPSKVDIWRDETTLLLQEKGYDEQLCREHVRWVEKSSPLLQRYSFLYLDPEGAIDVPAS